MNDREYQVEVRVYYLEEDGKDNHPKETLVYHTDRVLRPNTSIYTMMEDISFQVDQSLTVDEIKLNNHRYEEL